MFTYSSILQFYTHTYSHTCVHTYIYFVYGTGYRASALRSGFPIHAGRQEDSGSSATSSATSGGVADCIDTNTTSAAAEAAGTSSGTSSVLCMYV